MMIDVPVFIAFDCNPHSSRHSNQVAYCAGSCVFTLRYDTNDGDKPAQFCTGYPPTERSFWVTDKDGVLVGMLDSKTDQKLTKRAEEDPIGYAVFAS